MAKKNYSDFRYYLKFQKLKTWNCGIKMFWVNLWIRKNEFDSSLNIDQEAMSVMRISEQRRYLDNIYRRRKIAHERELKRNSSKIKNFLQVFLKRIFL
ncbi:MAG: hypothetical protein WC472_03980 [Candidatus Paceibacterota bacterium]